MVAVTEGEAGKSLSIWGHRKREEEAGRVAERGRGRKMKMQPYRLAGNSAAHANARTSGGNVELKKEGLSVGGLSGSVWLARERKRERERGGGRGQEQKMGGKLASIQQTTTKR